MAFSAERLGSNNAATRKSRINMLTATKLATRPFRSSHQQVIPAFDPALGLQQGLNFLTHAAFADTHQDEGLAPVRQIVVQVTGRVQAGRAGGVGNGVGWGGEGSRVVGGWGEEAGSGGVDGWFGLGIEAVSISFRVVCRSLVGFSGSCANGDV